jgi:hypothetical protein
MQQARSSEQKVADKKKIIKSAADPKSLLAWVAQLAEAQRPVSLLNWRSRDF